MIPQWLVGSRLGRAVAAVLAAILSILTLIKYGKSLQEEEQEAEDLKDYVEVKERADEVPVNTTRDAAIERLRSGGHLRDSSE